MRRSLFGGIVAVALLAVGGGNVAAQETGTPVFKSPYRGFKNYEFGGSLSDPGSNISLAVEGFFGYGQGPNDFGVRAGFSDPENGDAIFVIGGHFRTQVVHYSSAFPLDGSLTVGLGTSISDGDDQWRLPLGISLGRRFDLEGSSTTFVPYVHPVMIPKFGGNDNDVDFALGLGVDIKFTRELAVRVSGGLGDLDGVGVSISYMQ